MSQYWAEYDQPMVVTLNMGCPGPSHAYQYIFVEIYEQSVARLGVTMQSVKTLDRI